MRSNWRRRALLVFAVVGIVVAGGATAPAGASSGAVRVVFDKHLIDPANLVFEGCVGAKAFSTSDCVGGEVNGPLTSRLVPDPSNVLTGPVWTFTFDWIVSDGNRSFTARTRGTFDLTTGAVIMSGRVIDGFRLGAPVQEAGQLVDPTTFEFRGEIDILPGTA